jgi:hypothetical protein
MKCSQGAIQFILQIGSSHKSDVTIFAFCQFHKVEIDSTINIHLKEISLEEFLTAQVIES